MSKNQVSGNLIRKIGDYTPKPNSKKDKRKAVKAARRLTRRQKTRG